MSDPVPGADPRAPQPVESPHGRRAPTPDSPVPWAVLGALFAIALWFSVYLYGAIALLLAIVAAFVMVRRLGRRHAWAALLICGVLMTGTLAWATATDARCPSPGTTAVIKENKPEVSCDEIKASYVSMAGFFVVVAMIGAAWGLSTRRPA